GRREPRGPERGGAGVAREIGGPDTGLGVVPGGDAGLLGQLRGRRAQVARELVARDLPAGEVAAAAEDGARRHGRSLAPGFRQGDLEGLFGGAGAGGGHGGGG